MPQATQRQKIALTLDKGGELETFFFSGRLVSQEYGIQHIGDNLTGEGGGDDEQILVNLDQIGAKVQQVIFVVKIYTPQWTFHQVVEPFAV